MSVVTRPPEVDTDERTHDERVAELEALIEEARQRARGRRRRNAGLALAVATVAGVALIAGGSGVGLGSARSADGDAVAAAALDRGGAWSSPTGPPGFPATIVLDPSRPGALYLYVWSSGRVFRSTDGGRSWSSGRPVASTIDALTVDPRNGSILYAGTSDGVLKSTDAGRTWRRLGLAPPPSWARLNTRDAGYVYGVDLDPTDSRIVYARTEPGRLYRSTNGGTTWRRLWSAPSGALDLAIHPAAPTTLYAAENQRSGIMRSTDSGRTWRTVARTNGSIWSLAVDPARPGTIWAAGEAGVLVTRDGGTTWLEPGRLPAGTLYHIVVDPRHADTLYVNGPGWFRSTDGGRSWQPFGAGHGLDELVIDPRAPGTMYAGDGYGVVKTTDGGATWRRADAGIVASSINAVAPAPGRPATIYADGSFRLSRSDDRGRTWTVLGTKPSYAVSVAVDPRDHRHVVAGNRGIDVSRDGGASWVNVFRRHPGDAVHAIAFDPSDPRWVYAATSANGLIRSSDGGRTWRYLQGGDPGPGQTDSLAVHPENAGTVYTAGGGGSFAISTNGGDSWRYRSIPGLTNVRSIAVAPSDPDTLYAFSERRLPGVGTRLARSTDGGNHWQLQAGRGLAIRAVAIEAVAIDPERPQTVYVGTDGRGVLRSTDGGASWRPFGTRLPSRDVQALAFDATGTALYAGTNGAGLTSIRVR